MEFTCAARLPGVLYLEPEPSDGLRQLTLEIAGQWPEARPYRGAFSEIIPHLTVVHGVADGALDLIEARVLRSLPIATPLLEALLYVFDGQRWRKITAVGDNDRASGVRPTRLRQTTIPSRASSDAKRAAR